MTVHAGVAGQPIGHSLSPLLHRAWIAAAGLDATYDAFGPADEADFDALIAEGRAGALRGLNVTAPYKERALALADDVSDTARSCGSANLLVFDRGRLHADSTDGQGLIEALAEQAPDLALTGRSVILLGAGGAARAAAAALQGVGARVRIVNRTRARAEALAREVGGEVGGPDALVDAALVVNALSVAPAIDFGALPDDAVLMDMTYRPLTTAFLFEGRKRGHSTVDGLAMLIGQARPSFRAIFGMDPPGIDVRSLALEALEALE